jgi:L-lactate utilization protein LutC
MPRTLNFISGPSRTADIGGKLVVGAHGPQRLCVIIVKSTSRPVEAEQRGETPG